MATSKGILYLLPNLLEASQSPEAALPAAALRRARSLRRFVAEGEKAAWRLLSRVLSREEAAAVSMARLDEHTPPAELSDLLTPLEAGEDVGLVSEAGMPCIADPGSALAALAHDRGIRVVPLVGPSSILLGLAASGMDGQRFSFLGYLPQDSAARRAALVRIERDLAMDGATRIFIETPYRNAALLRDCLAVLSPTTRLCVAASLCGNAERIRSAPVSSWRAAPWEIGKEPAVFLVGRVPGTSYAPPRPAGAPRPAGGQREARSLDRGSALGHSGGICKSRRH